MIQQGEAEGERGRRSSWSQRREKRREALGRAQACVRSKAVATRGSCYLGPIFVSTNFIDYTINTKCYYNFRTVIGAVATIV